MEREQLKKVVECIIFISDKPVTLQRIQKVFPDLNKREIAECIQELISEWSTLDRGFKLNEVANGFQFRTSSDHSEHIMRFKQSRPFRLSRAALESLAIIAYNQPITRLEIDRIRGVDSSSVIGALLERRLVEIRGRKEVIGRPFLYGTSNEFLEVFGLKSLSDLPTLKELEEIESSIQQSFQRIDI